MARMDELSVDEQREHSARGNGGSFARRIEDSIERATAESSSLSEAVESAVGDLGSMITAAIDSRQSWGQSLTRLRDVSQREIERLQQQIAKLDELLEKIDRPAALAGPEPKVVVLDDEGNVHPGPPIAQWTESEIRAAAAGDFGIENDGSPGWFSAGRPNTWLNDASYVEFLKRAVPYLRPLHRRTAQTAAAPDEQAATAVAATAPAATETRSADTTPDTPARPAPEPKKSWRDYLR